MRHNDTNKSQTIKFNNYKVESHHNDYQAFALFVLQYNEVTRDNLNNKMRQHDDYALPHCSYNVSGCMVSAQNDTPSFAQFPTPLHASVSCRYTTLLRLHSPVFDGRTGDN